MLGLDQIYCGDCRDLLKDLDKNSIDCVVSDIPYGICLDEWDVLHKNKNSALLGKSPAQQKAGRIFRSRGKPLNGWSAADKAIPQEYYHWCMSWAAELFRVTKPGATVFIFAGRRLAHRAIAAFEDCGFFLKDMLAWQKEKCAYRAQHLSKVYTRRGDLANASQWQGWKIGNLKPVFEPILWLMKPYKIGTTIADNVLKNGLGAFNEAVINIYDKKPENSFVFSTNKNDSGLHPAQKPLKLIEFLIELVTVKEHVVLDPFAGSGTTLKACQKLKRKYIGFENNNEYYLVAKERLAQ